MGANEPMPDERLARLAADNEPAGDHLSGLTADEVVELVAEVKRWRAVEANLRATIADEHTGLSQELENAEESAERVAKSYRDAVPWYQMPHGIDRELAKYYQCEEPGDCDHDHDNALDHFHEQELNELRRRAETAERELAEMRERIGQESVEWGVRIYDDDPDEAIESISSEQQARLLAVAWQDEVEGSNPTAVNRTRYVGKWKAANDGRQ